MILGPNPSLLIVFVRYHYLVHGLILRPILHALAIYTLTFLAFSSLIVVLARDPGPVNDKSQGEDVGEGEEEDFMQALLAPPEGEEAHGPGKWCKKCNAPKPERAHHCGTCGRCVLKMGACLVCLFSGLAVLMWMHTHFATDHHCLWLGHKCIVRLLAAPRGKSVGTDCNGTLGTQDPRVIRSLPYLRNRSLGICCCSVCICCMVVVHAPSEYRTSRALASPISGLIRH